MDSSSRQDPCGVVNETIETGGKDTNSTEIENDCCREAATTAGATDSRFSCNICFEEVSEPVVTRCGHLYCWECLFQWLEPGMCPEERTSLGMSPFRLIGSDPRRRLCPVCKSPCPLSTIVPLYVRSSPSARSSRCKTSIESQRSGENEMDQSESDPNEAQNDENVNTQDTYTNPDDEGLRRRRINQPSDFSNENNTPVLVPVPNRPLVTYQEEPSSPRRNSPGSPPQRGASTDNPYRVGGVQLTPRSPNGHNGSLMYGIISSLQRATAEYYRANNNTNEQAGSEIPSLHDRRNPLTNHNSDGSGRFEGSGQDFYNESNGNLNSETTQYLTRLLIMFTSFVIFCFLAV